MTKSADQPTRPRYWHTGLRVALVADLFLVPYVLYGHPEFASAPLAALLIGASVLASMVGAVGFVLGLIGNYVRYDKELPAPGQYWSIICAVVCAASGEAISVWVEHHSALDPFDMLLGWWAGWFLISPMLTSLGDFFGAVVILRRRRTTNGPPPGHPEQLG